MRPNNFIKVNPFTRFQIRLKVPLADFIPRLMLAIFLISVLYRVISQVDISILEVFEIKFVRGGADIPFVVRVPAEMNAVYDLG